jgi:2-polyprenyl-3-methyl-5-hydroxy-6-metoxy-1,4-benzoquinol methylase
MTYDRNEYRSNQTLDYISIFYPELKKEFKECKVLDVGCGSGTVAISLARYAKCVLGIDPFAEDVIKAREEAEKQSVANARFAVMSAYDLKASGEYDVVVLSDVLEHVPDQAGLLSRCLAALAPGGVLYLNTPNKWFPMEPHKKLLFLSYMPKKLANKYAVAFGSSVYEGYHLLSYRELLGLLDSIPVTYNFKTQPNPRRRMYRIGNRLVTNAPFLWRFANAFQVVIQHK